MSTYKNPAMELAWRDAIGKQEEQMQYKNEVRNNAEGRGGYDLTPGPGEMERIRHKVDQGHSLTARQEIIWRSFQNKREPGVELRLRQIAIRQRKLDAPFPQRRPLSQTPHGCG